MKSIVLSLLAVALGPASQMAFGSTAASSSRANFQPNEPVEEHQNPGDAADRALTEQIRREILRSDLSVKGKSVEIQSYSGKVVLRGNVASEAEKMRITQIAGSLADQVDDRLKVKN